MSLPIEWMSPLTVANTTRPSLESAESGRYDLHARNGDLHRLGRDHHLRQEHLAAAVGVAEPLDRGREHAADDLGRGSAGLDDGVHQRRRGVGVAAQHRRLERSLRVDRNRIDSASPAATSASAPAAAASIADAKAASQAAQPA